MRSPRGGVPPEGGGPAHLVFALSPNTRTGTLRGENQKPRGGDGGGLKAAGFGLGSGSSGLDQLPGLRPPSWSPCRLPARGEAKGKARKLRQDFRFSPERWGADAET